jgi:predicted lipoprotein with Yx(FWY)xxD motif
MGRLAAAAALSALALALPALAAAPLVPPGVSLQARGDGWWFHDAKGLVLYTYERDERTPGQSACDAACAKVWPPLIAPADAAPVGEWTTIARDGGTRQWAYKGRPLYTYAEEGGSTTSYGDGQAEQWYVAYQPLPTPVEFSLTNTLRGRVLADSRGMTVYTFDKDKAGDKDKPAKSACTGACLRTWAPVEAPLAATGREDWTAIKRDDGTKQWAYKGKPLYRYRNEAAAGEAAGDKRDGAWHAVVLEPAPTYPAWVTVQHSDAGALLADSKGKTIYTRNMAAARRGFGAPPKMCGDEPCLGDYWEPVLASDDGKPEGNWSIMTTRDGKKQWAYRGMLLYTHTRDLAPGDFKGIQFGGDKAWATIMRSGIPMQGVSVGGG